MQCLDSKLKILKVTMNKNNWDLIKLTDYKENNVYINKKYIARMHENSQGLIEIMLMNQSTIYIKNENLDSLADKLSI